MSYIYPPISVGLLNDFKVWALEGDGYNSLEDLDLEDSEEVIEDVSSVEAHEDKAISSLSKEWNLQIWP